MKQITLLFIFLFSINAWSQQKFTISGNVKNAETGEELIGAKVRLKDQNLGAVTNEYGFYSLTLKEGNYTLLYQYPGTTVIEKSINLTANQTINVELTSGNISKELKEVDVTAKRADENVKEAVMGVEKISPKELAKLPVIFGEKDIIKTMQLLPGVKNAGEGGAGFYVRGGAADQNLVLLDEAPVYNASHLLGFFSTFNSDAIKEATLYKGNQPANFGGRLSSVLDIRMNEGNNKKLNVGGGIGLIASRLSIEAPIIKDKASFLITARRTYADVFLKATEKFKENTLYFYDLNTKFNYRINEKNKLFASGYFGRDVLGLGKVFGLDWGNATGTLRWNHIFSSKLFSNTSFIYSNYGYKFKISGGDVDFTVRSQIQDFNIKQEFQYFLNTKNKLKFGANVIRHSITPGKVEASESSGINVKNFKPTNTIESALYITNEWSISDRINVNYGLRGTALTVLGSGDEMYTYNADGSVASTNIYDKGKILKTYFNIEPRASISWEFMKGQSFKAAYSRNTQNIHQVSNSTSGSPTDVWLSTSLNTKPEIADQVAFGWFKNFFDNQIEVNIETYYKYMHNQLDYRNGANQQANEKLEGELLYGQGRAYGLEFIIKKKKGDFTGWIGYTLSKTERQINGINLNNWYNAKQDRTHDLSVVAMYDINKKISISALFVFYTGNAVTFPSGKYQVDGETYFNYTDRNGSRMPNYHRLDIALTLNGKSTDKFESSWNFSIYNVYGRENAYSIDFRPNADDPNKTEAVQTTLFRFVPAITYNFKFK